MRGFRIGSVVIENPFVLAPMAGVTDLAFRKLCKEQGAGLICMEMVSAKAIGSDADLWQRTGADGKSRFEDRGSSF